MSVLVIDASVAVKWVLNEPDSALAEALIDQDLIAPDFLQLECANTFWTASRRNVISASQAKAGFDKIRNSTILWRPIGPHVDAALTIAFAIDRTVYDCLYLAIATAEGVPLVTADLKFAGSVEAHADYRGFIRRLT